MSPPLDPVTARCFPSLARYARKVRRLQILAWFSLALAGYVVSRDVLSAYQGRVATEHMMGMMGRVNTLETTCQRDYPKRLTMTKAAAQVTAQRKEDARKERE